MQQTLKGLGNNVYESHMCTTKVVKAEKQMVGTWGDVRGT